MLPSQAKQLLLDVYNFIWNTHTFPQQWKEATALPIHKPGKPKDDAESYKPISLTCTMCKILEKIVNNRLMWYLEQQQLLTNAQSGFRKERSTLDNITLLESEIHEAFAAKQKQIAVSFDIEKAFEMTWLEKIVRQLHKWEIKGTILSFVQNFLSQRKIQVKANDALSAPKLLENGTPQGSVLSTTFFLMAINDVTTCFSNPIKPIIYADDLIIYTKGKDIKSSQ